MHRYLRAIGFSNFKSNEEAEAFIRNAVSEKYLTGTAPLEDGAQAEQYQLMVAPGMGVSVVGERNADGHFMREYYFPYMRSYDATVTEASSVDRHAEKESYSGVLDDFRSGISLIFYLCNSVQYRALRHRRPRVQLKQVYLTGLSVEGKILLPIEKREEDAELLRRRDREQSALIEAARNGDQEAMETLTATDMDLYARIGKRMEKEDLYSVVESSFMPTGVECDQYQILGEILAMRVKSNVYTHENVVDMKLLCNNTVFHVCINEADLLGIPAVGRRFKGVVWMQGEAEFR